MNSKSNKVVKSTEANWFTRLFESFKEFFVPKTEAKRKIRNSQALHVFAFVASTVAFIYFEERIIKLISLEANEISKGRFAGPSPF